MLRSMLYTLPAITESYPFKALGFRTKVSKSIIYTRVEIAAEGVMEVFVDQKLLASTGIFLSVCVKFFDVNVFPVSVDLLPPMVSVRAFIQGVHVVVDPAA